jgi:hypothetical protein
MRKSVLPFKRLGFGLLIFVIILVNIPRLSKADFLIPTTTTVYFEKDGAPHNKPVSFEIKCYGYSWPPGPSPEKKPGTYTPEVVFTLSASCPKYGCEIDDPYYLNYRHIDYCDLEGQTEGSSFLIPNYADEPVSDCIDEGPDSRKCELKFTIVDKPIPVQAPEEVEEEDPISENKFEVILPEIFTEKNSSTTNMDSITETEELKAVEGFTIEVANQNKVSYQEALDLREVEKLENLDKYVFLSEVGKVTIESEEFPELGRSASITMRNLDFKETPKILKDGEDASSFVSNINYEQSDGVLTFDVTGFSTYEAVASDLEITETPVEETVESYVGFYIGLGICFGLFAIISVIVLVVLYKKRKKKDKVI